MERTFTESGIILPNFKDLPESSASKLSLEKFAKYMDKIFLEDLTSLHPELGTCTLYSHFISDYYITIDFNTFTYVIPNHIIDKLNECKTNRNIRFYVIPIILKFTDEDSHANVLIVDNKTKTIEMYEPHGSKFLSNDIFYEFEFHIKNLIGHILSRRVHFKFKNVHYKCPIGFQTKQTKLNRNTGHCVAWTLFFIHVRLYNLDLNTTDIIDILDNFDANKLDRYIRQYITLVDKETRDVKKFYKDSYLKFNLTPKEQEHVKKIIKSKVKQYFDNLNTNNIPYTTLSSHNINNIFKEFIKYSQFDFFHNLYFKTVEEIFHK
jgi:hypothetical protein